MLSLPVKPSLTIKLSSPTKLSSRLTSPPGAQERAAVDAQEAHLREQVGARLVQRGGRRGEYMGPAP
eukprot:CAMPEP_0172180990 /NCGR_PEP_ID=MMETSP1050-20130122/17560_1 /TAXON_ID=233186 /ORGANISM="Cryptomonas curvata, Strain CCAP979/52" /LENGTH=66 /DNA_ID=CAMNT_0012854205 /DNA_START=238 /DNA_END=435 /DNA_ORIENTATION=+